jgi:hypothetical protein
VLAKALAGLHAAHQLADYDGSPLNLIHRDVSPHNVFVQYDGQVKVLDFGIAKAAGSEIETEAGVMKGKLRYMAPEQLMGDALDARADVFAIGVMLYEAISGRRLWEDRPDADVLRCLVTESVPQLEDPEIPKVLRTICNHAIACDPQKRYASAESLQEDLEAFVSTELLDPVGVLSEFLEENFGQARRTTQQLVQTQVKLASEPPEVRPSLTPRKRSSSSEPTRVERSASPWRRRLWLAAAAGTLALAGAVLLFETTRSGGQPAVASNPGAGAPDSASPLVCPAGQKLCDAQCVSVDRPEYGCGAEECHPCQVLNATPRCNGDHQCDVAVCYQDYDDCDGNRSNGCESAVRVDPDHCGGCGKRCPELPHAERGCGDACTIWRCQPGFRDCNYVSRDGCEVDTEHDAKNCGACGNKCRPGQVCERGACKT